MTLRLQNTEVLFINLNLHFVIFREILYLKVVLKWHKDYNGDKLFFMFSRRAHS